MAEVLLGREDGELEMGSLTYFPLLGALKWSYIRKKNNQDAAFIWQSCFGTRVLEPYMRSCGMSLSSLSVEIPYKPHSLASHLVGHKVLLHHDPLHHLNFLPSNSLSIMIL